MLINPNLKDFVDSPIESAEQDLLSRGQFANLVANALLVPKGGPSNVVGVVGPWGSGKSFVANLVVSHLKEENLTVVRFDPWMVTTREALVVEFFNSLIAAAFPCSDTKEQRLKRARMWEFAAKASGIFASATKLVVPGVVSRGVVLISRLSSLAAQSLESQNDGQSLEESKEKISKDLCNLEKPIVVVIDDIDRLTCDEIKTVFQLVKSCADFPNVHYLLLFDRDQVTYSLNGSVNDPEAFLEKIVNLQLDLPEFMESQRIQIVKMAIGQLDLPSDLSKEAEFRVANVIDQVLLPALDSMRKVKRYVIHVKCLIPSLKSEGYHNFDPGDLLLLEYLRQYVPSLWQVLRDEAGPLRGASMDPKWFPVEHAKDCKELRDLAIQKLCESQRELARCALELLASDTGPISANEKRFSSPLWKSVYLGFESARASIPEDQWTKCLNELKENVPQLSCFEEFSDQQLRKRWTDTIIARCNALPIESCQKLMSQLLSWGEMQQTPEFDWARRGLTWFLCVNLCLRAILDRLSSLNLNPVDQLEQVIRGSNSIVAVGQVLVLESALIDVQRQESWSQGYDLEALMKLLRERISQSEFLKKIWDSSDVFSALEVAELILDREAFRMWQEEIAKSDKLVVNYLNSGVPHTCRPSEGSLREAIRNVNVDLLTDIGKDARNGICESILKENTGN